MSSLENSFLIVLLSLTIFLVNCQAEDSDVSPRPPGMHFFSRTSKANFDKCLAEAGLTKEDLKAFREEQPKEPTGKQLCLAKCLSLTNGLIGKDGMIASDLFKITKGQEVELPTSCSNIPKTNHEKHEWLTLNLRENLCQLWECLMDLLEKGEVLVFDTDTHSVKEIKDVPHDPDDPFNTVTETLLLKECVNVVLGHQKLNCEIDLGSYMELTACSLGMDHKKEENLKQVESLFRTAFT